MSQPNKLQGALVMSKADFWYLIEETRTSCGEDQETYLRHLGEWLKALGPDYAQDFHDILHAYVELADKLGLWSAATLMGRSSEHDFENFRSWLISHGQDVYLAALKDPDTLADIDPGDGDWFERLTYAGATVLYDLTGRNAYKESDLDAYKTLLDELDADIEYGEGIDYPFEANEMPEFFPRLFPKYRDTVIKIVQTEGRIWNPMAAQDEMQPKVTEMEVKSMKENTRTLAFQVPESLYQRVNAYKERNHMTLRSFVLGLIEEELDRDEELLRKQQEDAAPDEEEAQDEDLSESGEAPVSEGGPGDEYEDEQEETPTVGDSEGGLHEPGEEESGQEINEAPPDRGFIEGGLGPAFEVAPHPDFGEDAQPPFPEPESEEDQEYGGMGMSM